MPATARLYGSLDANIILRLLTRDISRHNKRLHCFRVDGVEFEDADMAIIEAIYVLHEYYKVPRKLVAEAIEAFQTNINLRIGTRSWADMNLSVMLA